MIPLAGSHPFRRSCRKACLTWLLVFAAAAQAGDNASAPIRLNQAATQYLALIENFAGFAEQHWNQATQSYDAKGTGDTWARGNGGVTLVNAVLLTEFRTRRPSLLKESPATYCWITQERS